jgi:Zn-dependent peptidase ImmA (M78 family)
LTIPHFRTVNDEPNTQPSPDLIDTLYTMEQRQDWMRDYLKNLGFDPLSFVGSARLSDNPKDVAKSIRIELGLENGWAANNYTWEQALRTLIRSIEDIGILVVVNGVVGNNTHRKLNVNEFRGFVLIDDLAPLIFINGSDAKAAQMFTLAHELAHIWYGVSAIFDLKQLQPSKEKIELLCNHTAAEFLIPEEDLRKSWQKVLHNDDRFQCMAREFKVSEIVAARRTLDLKLISKKEFLEFYENYQKRNKKKNGNNRGDFYATQNLRIGRKFAEAVIRTTREGKLLYQDAYRLTGLSGDVFENFAKHLEGMRYQ